MFIRRRGSLRLRVHRRETPGRRERQRDCDIWKAGWRVLIDDVLEDPGRSSPEKTGSRRLAGSFGNGDNSLALPDFLREFDLVLFWVVQDDVSDDDVLNRNALEGSEVALCNSVPARRSDHQRSGQLTS